jgi:hypothetical protein
MTRVPRPAWYRHLLEGCAFVGFYPERLAQLRRLPRFVGEARAYRAAQGTHFPLDWSDLHPILNEYRSEAGVAHGHYFRQDLWAARRIHEARPPRHVDIGSRIDGFVAHLLTFMPVTVLDIRPLTSDIEGLSFVQGDVCRLDGFASASVPSVSSLHAIEHVGLGRYGDPVDPNGCFTALGELARIVAPAGRLYLGLPIGRERVAFNSERVFDPRTVIGAVGGLRLVRFDAISDQDRVIANADPAGFTDALYSCGLFEFTRD